MIEHPAMPDMLLPGDIILTRGHGFIDFFIRLAQALARGRLRPSPYSHAAICTGPWTVMDADVLKTLASRSLEEWLEDVSYEDSVVYRRPVPTTFSEVKAASDLVRNSYEDDPNYISLGKSQSHNLELTLAARYFSGRRYNWLFLRSKASSPDRRSFFCSEFVMTLMSRSDPDNFRGRPEKTLPIDLPEIFHRAGWTVRKLRDLYLAPKAVSQSAQLSTEKESVAFEEFLKENPEIAKIREQLEAPETYHFRSQELLKKSATTMIETETVHLGVAEQVSTMLHELRKYYAIIIRNILDAKDSRGVRDILNLAGMSIDMRGMPPILEWLTDVLRRQPSAADAYLEQLEGVEAESSNLTKVQLCIQSLRVSFFLADIERVISRFPDTGNGSRKTVDNESCLPLVDEKTLFELNALLAGHPYLIEIDGRFETIFEQKLAACTDAIREAAAKLPDQAALKPECGLLDLLQRTRMVFPLAHFYRSLIDKPASS
ncbi:hypothetical protein GA0061098_1016152 [Bradyrhizobium shewense]|uniref:Permuted papain-like amidase enzyme, YaeF/YiiX, C92 family n=1 Tax=Bradyrhizobium shewense TaxID=1761772 RepID=A0A1C3XIN2_9BRAD|nr:hypothetical protein [Bradyrhizobium shewense]SCB52069.1 hypothetical protein GA0061098_1016152 [Bradyrhizobium shewense]